MKAIEWIDRVKQVRGWDSDYRIAKEMGMTRSNISLHRTRGNTTLDEDSAIKIAEFLGLDPVGIIIDQLAERTKRADLKEAIQATAKERQITLIVGKVAVWHDAISSFLCFQRTTKNQGAMALI